MRKTLEMAGAATDGRILVSSFNLGSLIYAHQVAPHFPLVLNLEPEHNAELAHSILAVHSFLYGLCVDISTLHEEMVSVIRKHGKRIAVYTCNSDEEISRALTLGVDVLISDVPQKALLMRGQR